MQHSGGICALLKAGISAIFCAGVLLSNAAVAEQQFTQQMQLTTDGETLTLLLRPSRVTENISVVNDLGIAIGSGVETYTGKIKGDPESWVRLTQSADSLDGVISRFGKRFRLQQSGSNPLTIAPLAGNHDFRIKLTSNGNVRNSLSDVYRSEVTRVANIGIVVDSKYNAHHDGKGLEYALSVINAVDGIYREEFGLALQIGRAINITNPANDPFDYVNTPIETMLFDFRDYRIQNNLLGQDLSLVHLFSGSRPSDEPVGLAWIDTACRTDGYDVGLSTPYQHDILLAAHEIAHNLGALHDSETACSADTGKVMWPYISAATSQQFSSCTVRTVKRILESSCHAEAIDLELALSVNATNTVAATVRNTDTMRATPAATLAIDLPDGDITTLEGNCQNDQNNDEHIECAIGALAPGADSVVVFQINSESTDELLASVEPETFIDLLQHNNSATVTRNDDAILVVSQGQQPKNNLSIVQSDLPTTETTFGGNSGSGTFTAFPFILIIALRRRVKNVLKRS